MSDIKTLASSVVMLGEESQETTGMLLVLESAVLALVQSHPDHERVKQRRKLTTQQRPILTRVSG